jgi:MscS family membrane protein
MLAIGVALALLAASLMRMIALPVLRRVFRSLTGEQDDRLLVSLVGPLRGVVALLVLEGAISFLRLPLYARQFWFFSGGSLAIIFLGSLFVRVVYVSGRLLNRHLERRGGADATAVIRLGERTLSVLTFCFVGFLLLKQAGLVKDATTLVAGVSVGGIAIAFAAQKTLENLLGGISIIFDKTIRVGDYCKIGTQSGSVEDIGLRSTSLRTDERTVLTIPNGQLSTMAIENFAMKEKIFFHHIIGIRRETTAEQMRGLLDALRKLLAGESLVDPSSVGVRLVKFGTSSFDLEFTAYVLTTDGTKFLQTQEDLLLRIMDTIEATGTAAAFPSQTLYLGRDKTK